MLCFKQENQSIFVNKYNFDDNDLNDNENILEVTDNIRVNTACKISKIVTAVEIQEESMVKSKLGHILGFKN